MTNHNGVWAILPQYEGVLKDYFAAQTLEARASFADAPLYAVAVPGVASIEISGPMIKGRTFFGTDMTRTRKAFNEAANDNDVKGILLMIDSPGGMVAGLDDLATDIAAVNQKKPVVTYAEDTIASAAYYAGSQSQKIVMNRTGMAGSIGVMTYIDDTSRMFEKFGIKRYLITSGGVKGAGTDGVPVTEEVIDDTQRIVDGYAKFFVQAVAQGRGMSEKRVYELADARMHFADEALERGLIDAIGTANDALTILGREIKRREAKAKAENIRRR